MEVALLDPSSLSLWFDATAFVRAEHGAAYADAMTAAIHGDTETLKEIVDDLDETGAARATQIAESVWHEKRHFLDLLLTNYGAFRLRQFTRIYINLGQVLSIASKQEEGITLPVTVYADAVRLRQLGVPVVDEFVSIGKNVATMDRWFADERTKVRFGSRRIEIGGEAQLEALAFMSQKATAGERLSPRLAIAADHDRVARMGHDLRYEWLHRLAVDLGIARTIRLNDDVVTLGVTALGPMIIASLMSRHYGQEQVVVADADRLHGSGRPSYRIAGLLGAFRGREREMREWDFSDAWAAVNEVCSDLWGRTALEEMDADLAAEATLIDEVAAGDSLDVALRYLRTIHAARTALRLGLDERPDLVCCPLTFGSVVDALDPLLVQIAPHGADPAELQGGWGRLHGYEDPTEPPIDGMERWWWSAVWQEPRTHGIGLTDRSANIAIADEFAPLTKLLLAGRRHRVMLGAEAVGAEATLERIAPYRFDPYFSTVSNLVERSNLLFYLTEAEVMRCDWCFADVGVENSRSVSAWAFRGPEVGAEAVRKLGGGKVGYLRLIRDWSPWVLCVSCVDEIGVAENWISPGSAFEPTEPEGRSTTPGT